MFKRLSPTSTVARTVQFLQMSGLINSLLNNSVVRQARRFSSSREAGEAAKDTASENDAAQRSHVNEEAHERMQDLSNAPGPGPQPAQAEDNLNSSSSNGVSTRVPAVARANGFQGLIPMDDMRSNYIFDQTPVASPTTESNSLFEEIEIRTDHNPIAERSTMHSLSSMSLDETPTMTANPSFGVPESLRTAEAGSISSRSYLSLDRISGSNMDSSGERSPGSSMMSGTLPADDGMRAIREQIHQIREMALSADEKAKQMHALMMADYTAFKKVQLEVSSYGSEERTNRRRRTRSRRATGNDEDCSDKNSRKGDPLYTSPEDLRPTYQPRSPSHDPFLSPDRSSETAGDEELELGCKHYMRNVKIQCFDCDRWYTCRHCHDEVEEHLLNRKATQHMLCMLCQTAQNAAEYCSKCGEAAAAYYCDICKLWDNDGTHRIYHCMDCGICRRGEGLGKDYVHCKVGFSFLLL